MKLKLNKTKHLHDLSICAKYVNMTDINSNPAHGKQGAPLKSNGARGLSHDQERILSLMELFYFAYRDFTGESDEVLEKIGFGRAHHRVIHFVHHYPGLRVADLLNILKITKQSLARVLKQLIDQNYISQRHGHNDRRERLLFTTTKGQNLAQKLAIPQIDRFIHAIGTLDAKERITVEKFLFSLIDKDHRHDVYTLMDQNGHKIEEIKNTANPKER